MRTTFLPLYLLGACALGACGHANAGTPRVPSNAPYIVLSENHDEPNGFGLCLDTYGPGQSELMQTHSCKPSNDEEPRSYAGNDTRFEYNASTMQVESYPFEGFCMQVLVASDKAVFALLPCSDHPHQKFVYEQADQTLRLHADSTQCVAVAEQTLPAGPWVKRALELLTCDEATASLKQWNIVGN